MAEVSIDPNCSMATWELNVRTTLLLVPLLAAALWQAWPRTGSSHKKHELTWVDHALGLALIVLLIHNIGIRFTRGVAHWNLQPCHLLTTLFIITIYHPDNSPQRFLFYFYSVWMPLLGLLFSDPGWYVFSYEQPMFNIQHILMVVAPWYYVYTGRYDLEKVSRTKTFIFAASICMLYCIFLIWVAFHYQEDFCAMRCRPTILDGLGTWWREAMLPLVPILCFLFGPLPDLAMAWLSPHEHVKVKSPSIAKKVNGNGNGHGNKPGGKRE